MVVAVSFRKASEPSYSSIVGAEARVWINLRANHTCDVATMGKNYWRVLFLPEMLVVTFSVVAGPNPLEVDARIESWYVTPGWS